MLRVLGDEKIECLHGGGASCRTLELEISEWCNLSLVIKYT